MPAIKEPSLAAVSLFNFAFSACLRLKFFFNRAFAFWMRSSSFRLAHCVLSALRFAVFSVGHLILEVSV